MIKTHILYVYGGMKCVSSMFNDHSRPMALLKWEYIGWQPRIALLAVEDWEVLSRFVTKNRPECLSKMSLGYGHSQHPAFITGFIKPLPRRLEPKSCVCSLEYPLTRVEEIAWEALS